jgi:hypothetical protein
MVVSLALGAGCARLEAQPFVGWAQFEGNGSGANGHLEIADAPDLRPAVALTLEAWFLMAAPPSGTACQSLVGKNSATSYWMGVCGDGAGGTLLRSSIAGPASVQGGGVVPTGVWTHLAVTTDGAVRRHYVDGELVASGPETTVLGVGPDPLWIGSDSGLDVSPMGMVNDVRLWRVARAASDLQATLNVDLASPQTGLVGVWRLADASDALGAHPGAFSGSYTLVHPQAGGPCTASGQTLCLWNRFVVTASWRIGPPGAGGGSGVGNVAGCPNPGSGLFWFFDASNWELVVKAIDGCTLNNRWWIFSAAMTNVFYRLDITDLTDGVARVYFNYPGPPAPAVTDTVALPCP